ncbi:patatin-like phospholipase family protein [Planctomycetes bacterium K23_9]|uniref:NTE family protein RssA n=1 Tax=Stieleria marina TaxID=1930275 RepID=A0A517NPT3_9BACT|nr:NTE family protein RssA [Planctomycetes bacterium K23_9]
MDETITRSLFVGLVGEELQEVLDAFESRSFQAGETIVKMGDEGDELFLIVTGKVRVWTGDGPASNERTLSVMGPGEHFGEASMISGKPRSATVTALTYLDTLVLRREGYQRLLPKHPELLHNISRSLTRRLTTMNTFTNQKGNAKRGIHSLAILVDTDQGWALGAAMLGQLRRQGMILHPLIVSDGELPFDAKEIDNDAILVSSDELAIKVAQHAGDISLAVAIAYGQTSIQAAAKECDRVILAIDDPKRLSGAIGKVVELIPLHRRPIVAIVHPSDQDGSPPELIQSDQFRCMRVSFSRSERRKPHEVQLDQPGVVRVARYLSGVRIGLALGGGGARGIAHVGVTQVFAEHGIVFDSIAATSAGAIVGGALAAGYTPQAVGQFFRDDMIPPRIFASRPALRRAHLLHSFRGGRFEKKLRRYLHQLAFGHMDLPLAITTLDLISGVQLIRRQGDVVHSILQSINHPVFGSPIIHGKEMLVDGGVLMNVPASVLREEGCDFVISIDVGSTLATDFATGKNGKLYKPSYLSTLLRTMELSRRHSSELHALDSDMIVVPETQDFRIEDFHAVDPLIEAGIAAGEKSYTDVIKLIESVTPMVAP